MKPIVIGAIVVIVLILMSSAAVVMTNRPKQQALVTPPRTSTKAPRTKAPSTTPPATTAPAKTTSTTTVVYPDYAAGIIPPLPSPSFVLVPGANFPGLLGIRRDEASTYIITRYPRLVVRAVPLGSQVTYDVRSDRVTLSYDPYTNRIVNARIG